MNHRWEGDFIGPFYRCRNCGDTYLETEDPPQTECTIQLDLITVKADPPPAS